MEMEVLMVLVKAVALSVTTGISIGLWSFLSKQKKGETFDIKCMGETVAVSAVLGLLAYFQEVKITAENWQAYVAANAGVVHVADKGLSLARNWWLSRNG
jgi:hypothetical protein